MSDIFSALGAVGPSEDYSSDNQDDNTGYNDSSDIFPTFSPDVNLSNLGPAQSSTPSNQTLSNLWGSLFGTNTTGTATPNNLATGLTNLANNLFSNFSSSNQSPATSATAGNNIGGIPVTTWLIIGGVLVAVVLFLRK